MMMKTRMQMRMPMLGMLMCLLVIPATSRAQAQQQEKKSNDQTVTHLRVDIVLTEYAGDKRVSRLPYTLYVGVTDPQHGLHAPSAFLRMGVKVPIATGPVPAKGSNLIANYQYQYENVGTNIDVDATKLGEGLYRLQCTVERTAVSSAHQDGLDQSGILPLPTLTNFNSRFELNLRDGQNAEGMSATDPISGHVMKINVAVFVLK